ncbi:hypothetical protein [Aeromicrobium sp. Leaf291]|uniref:hypothetical protein n=1 Tax=Aeromicrobium sp. Leaf291 TaxID=1736325 RepID=UPI0006FA1BFE|nr:hypothetical protein [Aeromicrobium sp. Leaf291]KQP83726.1 hypothetical protein ASF35_01745 [Aeromicrobium sp. Leaf291]
MSHHTNRAPSHQWQPILNQQWPQRDDKGPHARDIPTATENTPVQARIHWRTDGWETVTGRVTRRANGCVYVEVSDPRMTVAGVWVSEGDVRAV